MATSASISLPTTPPETQFEREMLEFARQVKAAVEAAGSR